MSLAGATVIMTATTTVSFSLCSVFRPRDHGRVCFHLKIEALIMAFFDCLRFQTYAAMVSARINTQLAFVTPTRIVLALVVSIVVMATAYTMRTVDIWTLEL